MYEHRSSPLLHRRLFLHRMLRSMAIGACVILASLAFGMWGYHSFEGLDWVDSFVNAAMILAGMGPFSPLTHEASKLFAGWYALYSGFALVTTIGIIFAPVVHRFLHSFHLESGRESE
jgi:hypothetical protein